MHWLPVGETVGVEVLMPDCTVKKGIIEKNISKVKVGDVVQFERMFFARYDSENKFWFSHE